MQDLIQSYVSDLHKLREVFHKELEATAEELSKAMALYAKRCDAALELFMEKLRLARASLNHQRRQGLVSSAVYRQTAVERTSITDRLRRLHRILMRGSRPPQSRRSRIVCMSRAIEIASPSQPAQ